MSQHTPGPWRYRAPRDASDPPIVQRGNSGGFSVLDHSDPERAIADAKLIAAAPDLLDGCNALLGLLQLLTRRPDAPVWLCDAVDSNHRVHEARAAVAKTEGK